MGLLDEIRSDTGPPPRCGVGRLLHTLDEEDAEGLRVAVGDRSIPVPAIVRALERRYQAGAAELPEGEETSPELELLRVTADAVYRHRDGRCACRKRGLV